jgi:preprotein translocase subunit SecF
MEVMMKFLNSFLSRIPISWYIILFLAVSLSGSLWFLQGKIEEIGGLKVGQESYALALESSQKQLEMRELSCKEDAKSVVEVEAQKASLREATNSINEKLNTLRTPKSKENLKRETSNESSKVIQSSQGNYLPDDGLLSPNITSLLSQGYCAVYPTDNSCVSK